MLESRLCVPFGGRITEGNAPSLKRTEFRSAAEWGSGGNKVIGTSSDNSRRLETREIMDRELERERGKRVKREKHRENERFCESGKERWYMREGEKKMVTKI